MQKYKIPLVKRSLIRSCLLSEQINIPNPEGVGESMECSEKLLCGSHCCLSHDFIFFRRLKLRPLTNPFVPEVSEVGLLEAEVEMAGNPWMRAFRRAALIMS